jgi:hypothetical protein
MCVLINPRDSGGTAGTADEHPVMTMPGKWRSERPGGVGAMIGV